MTKLHACIYFPLHTRTQKLTNQENRLVMAAPVIGLGRSKIQPVSATNGRLSRSLHSSKAKVSETVTTSKE